MGKGFFESDEDYSRRITQEANERVIENSTGSAPSQGFFENDQDYRGRISQEAAERIVGDSTGSAPSQGFFEGDDDYRIRISREANERIVEDSTGSAPSQGFFEGDDDYRSRLRQEAHERIIEDSTGSVPSQGFFESKGGYRRRTTLEARESRVNARAAPAPAHQAGYEPSIHPNVSTKGGKLVLSLAALICVFIFVATLLRQANRTETVAPVLPQHQVQLVAGPSSICRGDFNGANGSCAPDENSSKLTIVFFYSGAAPNVSAFDAHWYRDGISVTQFNPVPVGYADGFFYSTYDTSLTPGDYSADLIVDGQLIRTLHYAVQPRPVIAATTSSAIPSIPNANEPLPAYQPEVSPGILSSERSVESKPQSATSSYEPPLMFNGTHKHAIGGCRGQLLFDSGEFRFISVKHPQSVTRDEIQRIDGNGFKDLSGKNWHFTINGMSKEQVHDLFANWFDYRMPKY